MIVFIIQIIEIHYLKIQPKNCIVNVIKLQTLRDGGILDPDDFIKDVVEDKEVV